MAGAGVVWMIDWTGEGGAKLSIRRKGEGEVLLGGLSIARGGDILFADDPIARGFIHDKRLFFWTGNDLVRLLVLPLLVLSDDSRGGDLC